uniref:EamA domain-containing protein n=1 Tax=Arion vulgaris TaxID=1028688 RepID=A0A0B6ZL93_9EUPU
MPGFPTTNEILTGIGFVFIGVIYTLADRWLTAVKFVGIDGPHVFDHFFIMWTLKQLFQLCLFFIWKAIDNNWCGCARFRHGDSVQRDNLLGPPLDLYKNQAHIMTIDEELYGTNIIRTNQPPADTNPVPHIEEFAINGDVHVDEQNPDDRATENEENVKIPEDDNAQNVEKKKTASVFVYLPPAVLSQAHVLLMFFGLKLTYGSSFMMLKGTVTIFSALLSVSFLAQQLACYVWFGIVVASLGFGISGISDYVHNPTSGYEKYGIAAGNLLIVMAQIMFATKIVYEEKFIRKYATHPMMFLGCEAFYGSVIAIAFMVSFNVVHDLQYSNLPNGNLEDFHDAIYQFTNNWRVVIAVLGSLFGYILFTYLGMFLIRDQGALPRIMIETFVWSFFWGISVGLKWERFYITQVPGLCVIGIGTLIYAHILVLPCSSRNEGIDLDVDLTEQFMRLDPANRRFFERAAKEENGVATEDVGAGCQNDEDDNLLGREVVVELHEENNDNDRSILLNADANDEFLIQA